MRLKRNGLDGLEVAEFMPRAFVLLYHSTVEDALGAQMRAQRTEDALNTSMPKKRFHTPDGGLKDETALAIKQRIDHELRRITRRINAGELDEPRMDAANRGGHCPECGRQVGENYHFCARCGLPLTDPGRERYSARIAKTISDSIKRARDEARDEVTRVEALVEETLPTRAPRLM